MLPVDDGRTLTDLTTWWLERWCPAPSVDRLLPGVTEAQEAPSDPMGNLPQPHVILGRAQQDLNLRPSGSKPDALSS